MRRRCGIEVHVINCGTMRPRGAKLAIPQLAVTPCLCLLIEADSGLVLIDSGLGMEDMQYPSRLGHANIMLNTCPNMDETAMRQVMKRGFKPEDVTDIICTHLDRDHAGGLPDFPWARVHVLRAERDAALDPPSFEERDRYRKVHFEHGPDWVAYEDQAEGLWFGLDHVRAASVLPEGIVMVPLQGHTRGHCGVAVETGDGWLFHCGDAYYSAGELEDDTSGMLGLRVFRNLAHVDRSRAARQRQRIKQALAGCDGEITTLASHDYEACKRLVAEAT